MHPIDRRVLATHVYSILQSLRKTAILLQVGHTTIHRWLKSPERKTYHREPLKQTSQVVQLIRTAVANDPFITCSRLQSVVKACIDVQVSRGLIHSVLKMSGFSRKKARMCGAPRNLEQKTNAFITTRDKYIRGGRKFYAIDETSFGRNTKAPYGYAPKGQKLFVRKSSARVTTTSVVACVGPDGWNGTMSYQGSVNTDRFLHFLEGLNLERGSVVLLDNVSFHHSLRVKAAFESMGVLALFTPPYSPWYNPIESCFSIVKRHFMKGQSTIEQSLQCLTAQHCVAFFAKSLNCVQPF